MRYFIALEVPEESKDDLQKVQQNIARIIPSAKITDLNKLHITVAFIGEQSEDFKEKLSIAIAKAVDGIKSFELTPAYLDGFPSIHTPKILWVGMKGDVGKLHIIRERIKDELRSLEISVDERRFIPHIALAKTKNFRLSKQGEKSFEEVMLNNHFDPIKVTSIKLFESIPNHGFHEHNTLAEIKLG